VNAPPVIDGVVVRAMLNEIVDPCSAAAGSPAGLVDMGLVRHVDVQHAPEGARVTVTIGLTEPACWMGFPFAKQATERLRALPGVSEVDVRLDPTADWSPSSMSPEYRQRLARDRLVRRRAVSLREG
jgi:metal-sulfur cluster biosynthetic enzyme